MTDDDLYLLHREELRLYQEYVAEYNGSSRTRSQAISPAQVEKKRAAWLAVHRPLRARLSPTKRREILQSRTPEGGARRSRRA